MDIKNKRALVIGLARSGIAAAKLLKALGAQVVLNDSRQIDNIDGLPAGEYIYKTGISPDQLIEDADFIVISPSVPPSLPALKRARELGKEVLTEIELGYRVCKGQTVAISGTNGKTTTTTLTGRIFSDANRGNFVVGNIGIPYSAHALEASPRDIMVTEISSYQLECIDTFHAHVAALLNITPDHLNRHGDMNGYIAAKKRLFLNQTQKDFAVLNYDDEIVRKMAEDINARVLFFSYEKELGEGVFIEDGIITFCLGALKQPICKCEDVRIKGRHNIENAMAAAAIGMLMGVSAANVAQTLMSFEGVEHRIETVRTVKGVTWINDSKGTNPDSTIKAIHTMDKPTVLILGGYDKGGEFDGLIKEYTDNIKHTVVLGDTARKIIGALERAGIKEYTHAAGFDEGVRLAFKAAQPGWNVLLSPACASFDMFADFEERGRVFKELVNSLEE